MQFCPRFREPLLLEGQSSADQFYPVNPVNSHVVLVISVEMRVMMWGTCLYKHTNYDTKKASNFRQPVPPFSTCKRKS